MQNLPRIFINEKLEIGKQIPLSHDHAHYLTRVMRVSPGADDIEFLIFNDGVEFGAKIVQDKSITYALCLVPSDHTDPSNKIVFCFAPIKQSRMEEMLNAATQMGVAVLQPVITERTTERFPKWQRIEKIIIEASEQSGRNSIPKLLPPKKFNEFLKDAGRRMNDETLIFADERFAHTDKTISSITLHPSSIFIGPEGGFSVDEFTALDEAGAVGISLGKTILRAETAAVAALAKIMSN